MNLDRVDMLNEARNAQWTPQSFLGDDYLRIISPAKVNLFLDVGKKRADGYHDVATVMHALSLSDSVYLSDWGASSEAKLNGNRSEADFTASAGKGNGSLDSSDIAFGGPAGNIGVRIEMVDKSDTAQSGIWSSSDAPAPSENLAFKAIDKLARVIGRSEDEMLTLRIEKSIPAGAGLGGGSSNAAAALLGAAHLWGVSDSGETLRQVASSLGADVPFFLHGGCCSFIEKGSEFERALTPSKAPLVVVKPMSGVSTAMAYEAFDSNPVEVPAELFAEFQNASEAEEVPLVNNLTAAAISVNAEIAEVIDWLSEENGLQALMSGSGSAAFAETEDYSKALEIAAAAKRRGWWARATTFSRLPASVIGAR